MSACPFKFHFDISVLHLLLVQATLLTESVRLQREAARLPSTCLSGPHSARSILMYWAWRHKYGPKHLGAHLAFRSRIRCGFLGSHHIGRNRLVSCLLLRMRCPCPSLALPYPYPHTAQRASNAPRRLETEYPRCFSNPRMIGCERDTRCHETSSGRFSPQILQHWPFPRRHRVLIHRKTKSGTPAAFALKAVPRGWRPWITCAFHSASSALPSWN